MPPASPAVATPSATETQPITAITSESGPTPTNAPALQTGQSTTALTTNPQFQFSTVIAAIAATPIKSDHLPDPSASNTASGSNPPSNAGPPLSPNSHGFIG